MADQPKHRNTREALIQAGINEINEYGVANLSMRRIAKACGVSPGAPYKHFSDRNDFIAAIIEAVNLQWRDSQLQLLETYAGDSAKQIVEMSTGYVRFLIENPHLAAILTLKDEEFDNVYHRLRGGAEQPHPKAHPAILPGARHRPHHPAAAGLCHPRPDLWGHHPV